MSLSEIHPSIVQLKCLKYFSLANSNLTNDAIPEDLGSISSLEVLDLRGNDFTALPILTGLSKLQTLQLGNCTKLQAIPDLPASLEILEANQCIALERMPDFSEMSRLRELHLNYSPKVTEIPGLDKCTNLNDALKEAILRVLSLSLSLSYVCIHALLIAHTNLATHGIGMECERKRWPFSSWTFIVQGCPT